MRYIETHRWAVVLVVLICMAAGAIWGCGNTHQDASKPPVPALVAMAPVLDAGQPITIKGFFTATVKGVPCRILTVLYGPTNAVGHVAVPVAVLRENNKLPINTVIRKRMGFQDQHYCWAEWNPSGIRPDPDRLNVEVGPEPIVPLRPARPRGGLNKVPVTPKLP